MSIFKIVILCVIWLGLIVTLATGYYYSPNFRVSRKDDPRAYWQATAVGVLLCLLATFIVLQL
jgi:predicted exporter